MPVADFLQLRHGNRSGSLLAISGLMESKLAIILNNLAVGVSESLMLKWSEILFLAREMRLLTVPTAV